MVKKYIWGLYDDKMSKKELFYLTYFVKKFIVQNLQRSRRYMEININGTSIIQEFAYSQILLSEKINYLQNTTNFIIKEYQTWELPSNLSKIKYLSIGKTEMDLLLRDGRVVCRFDSYKYLGVEINKKIETF